MSKSVLWLAPGVMSLVAFAWLLTLNPAESAGRAHAVYGGVYIATSLGCCARRKACAPIAGTSLALPCALPGPPSSS